MADGPFPPGATIGILGGGQLGRMLAVACAQLGFRCRIYCEEPGAPAFHVASSHVTASFHDLDAIREFAAACDVITFEFENVPVAAVDAAAALVPVVPGRRALEVTQDRLAEKRFLAELCVPTAPFRPVENAMELRRALEVIGRPAILKTRRLGYDGKGQVRIDDGSDVDEALTAINAAPAILEGFVTFDCEISVVGIRGADGAVAAYDLAENKHENQILKETRVPARVPASARDDARRIAKRIGDALDYSGVFCVELFYCGEGASRPLLANEIAPRVHNSGHWTLDGCAASQFENHIRAVAGWPLAPVHRHADAVMTNLIGGEVEGWKALAADETARLHIYGKNEARPGRKMGHVTRLAPLTTDS